MGAVFLSLFLANMIISWLGGFYESMTPTAFWAMHAGIASLGGVLAFVLRRPLMRASAIDDPETQRVRNLDRSVMPPTISVHRRIEPAAPSPRPPGLQSPAACGTVGEFPIWIAAWRSNPSP